MSDLAIRTWKAREAHIRGARYTGTRISGSARHAGGPGLGVEVGEGYLAVARGDAGDAGGAEGVGEAAAMVAVGGDDQVALAGDAAALLVDVEGISDPVEVVARGALELLGLLRLLLGGAWLAAVAGRALDAQQDQAAAGERGQQVIDDRLVLGGQAVRAELVDRAAQGLAIDRAAQRRREDVAGLVRAAPAHRACPGAAGRARRARARMSDHGCERGHEARGP